MLAPEPGAVGFRKSKLSGFLGGTDGGFVLCQGTQPGRSGPGKNEQPGGRNGGEKTEIVRKKTGEKLDENVDFI